MAYTQQIRILEEKLKQLSSSPYKKDSNNKTLQIEQDIKKLKRLEWEENYERLELEEDR